MNQTPEDWLKQKSAQIDKGERIYITVKNLLDKFNFDVKNESTIRIVKKTLNQFSLETSPKFWAVNMDCMVDIIRQKSANDDDKIRESIITFGMLKCIEDQRLFRNLNNIHGRKESYPKWIVDPQDNINDVAFILAEENVDFVPVGRNERSVDGVISWDIIATSVDFMGRNREKVKCRDIARTPIFVYESDSVYDKKHEIIHNGYVIVKDDDDRCFAILRSQDLAGELLTLTENFLLLQEIENTVRIIIEHAQPTSVEIDSIIRDEYKGRNLTLNQISFADYRSLILHKNVSERLVKNYRIPSDLIKRIAHEHIEHVRLVRNKVLHFHPDENNRNARMQLTNTRDFLRRIADEMYRI